MRTERLNQWIFPGIAWRSTVPVSKANKQEKSQPHKLAVGHNISLSRAQMLALLFRHCSRKPCSKFLEQRCHLGILTFRPSCVHISKKCYVVYNPVLHENRGFPETFQNNWKHSGISQNDCCCHVGLEYQTKWCLAFIKLTVGRRKWGMTMRPPGWHCKSRKGFLEEVTFQEGPEGKGWGKCEEAGEDSRQVQALQNGMEMVSRSHTRHAHKSDLYPQSNARCKRRVEF